MSRLLWLAAASVLALVGCAPSEEAMVWRNAQRLGTFGAYQEYLEKYPTGLHADQAFAVLVGFTHDGGGVGAGERTAAPDSLY